MYGDCFSLIKKNKLNQFVDSKLSVILKKEGKKLGIKRFAIIVVKK